MAIPHDESVDLHAYAHLPPGDGHGSMTTGGLAVLGHAVRDRAITLAFRRTGECILRRCPSAVACNAYRDSAGPAGAKVVEEFVCAVAAAIAPRTVELPKAQNRRRDERA